MINKLKQIFLYANIDKDQYNLIFPAVQERNLKNLRIYSLGMAIYFAVFFVYACIATGFNSLYYFYMADAVLMTLLFIAISHHTKRKHINKWVATIINYLFMALIYIDAIIITCHFPDRQSTAFYVRLVILPAICMDTPLRIIIFQILALIGFSIVTPMYNLPEIVAMDQSEAVSYVIISILIGLFISSIHIKEILHELSTEYLSNYDVLTGVKNRNSFEHEHIPLPNDKEPVSYYIYADVNGLHEMNNTYGHEAGDRMLKAVASGLIKIFGAESSYRIGGDEFVSFTDSLKLKQIESALADFNEELAAHNYHVSFGVAGSDEDFATKQEVIKAAEHRMYEEKKRYYQSKGEEFGARKRAY